MIDGTALTGSRFTRTVRPAPDAERAEQSELSEGEPMTSLRRSSLWVGCVAVAALLTLPSCGVPSASDTGRSNPVSGAAATASSALTGSTPGTAPFAACRDASKNCLGPLKPGSYASEFIDLFGTSKPGQVTHAVPSGWANTLDHQPAYWLRPAADYAADPGSDGNDTTSGIYVWGNVGAARQTDTCAEQSDPNIKTDAASLAVWIKGLQGLEAKARPTSEAGGHRAIVLDLTLNPARAQKCSFGPFIPLIASRPNAPDAYMWGIGVNEKIRIMLVELPEGHTAAVLIDGPTDQWEALLRAAKPILATLRLTPGSN